MSRNYSKLMPFILPVWVFISFMLAQFLVLILIMLAGFFGIPVDEVNESILNISVSAITYALMLLIGLGTPIIFKKMKFSKTELGMDRLPSWLDIIITPAGLIIYLIISTIFMYLASQYLPWVDINQSQDIGFSNLMHRFEYILAFIALVIFAPIAEEIIFRGFLFGKLKKYAPIWLAIVITSILFGLVHGQWAVAIDTFSLSVVLCGLRLLTGNIWAPILLHMAKNGIAYYFLFINPMILTKLVE